jgi:homoserine kinase
MTTACRSSHRSQSVSVRVPASTSNLGPGFDTLGVALNLYNHVRITPNESRGTQDHIDITSPISEESRPGAVAIVAAAAESFFKRARRAPFGFAIHLSGNVPVARGLGSSVTVRLGTMAALNAITGAKLDRTALFQLVADLEGHPDNAAPATFGSFTAAAVIGGEARCVRLPFAAKVRFVALIPPFEVPTEAARKLLPASYSKSDTVHNVTRVGLITAALATGSLGVLQGAFEDRVHQPYRQKLIPQLPKVLAAGEKAGAIGGWLSGSGSTIICLAVRNTEAIAKAMKRQIPGSEVRILKADEDGFVASPA